MVENLARDLARALHLSPTVFYLLFFAALLVVSLALGLILNRIIHHWTKKLAGTWGELIFSLLESLPVPLLFLSSLYTGLELIKLPHRIERVGSNLIFALTIVVVFYFPAKVLVLFLRRVGQRDPGMERVTNPSIVVVRVLFVILAIVIVLENLGISLTAVWTTLGVGSVAVALALQETLSNLFAGLYLLADRPVSPGDYIKLDSGQEGYVNHIGWRSTRMRTQSNNTVFVPNSTMAKAVIINYSLPELRVSVNIPVHVSYGSDPSRVEKALLDVTREAAQEGLDGLLFEPPPSVILNPGFGDSSLDFTLYVNVRRFEDQFPVQSELRKRILARFAQENINMPFPTRAIALDPGTLESIRNTPGKQWKE
jgi:small-conductance mechanosensitive channel